MKRFLILIFLLTFALQASTIVHSKIQSTISPATKDFFQTIFAEANKKNAELIVIELDTPGGLSTSMREMIQEILNSDIPVTIFVSPKGARAASAGTYMLYASHIAAMAPGTNLGAATPVSMGAPPTPAGGAMDKNISNAKSAMEKKVINDAMAYITSLAQLRDRNITWALSAVEDGKSLSARDALKHNVIDLMANDLGHLLKKIDKREVKMSDEESVVLATSGANLVEVKPDWKTEILMFLASPNVAYIFILLGIYGIIFEFMNPGAIFPGTIGAISGVIALYSLNILPFNYAGLLLILIGIMFMLAELFISTAGILGIGGVIAFALGSFLLFDANTLGSGVSIPLIIAFTIVSSAFFLFVLKSVVDARKMKPVIGGSPFEGQEAVVEEVKENEYVVALHGELWSGISDHNLHVGDVVIITEQKGLTLEIERKDE